jgi:hypothetical protein
VSTTLLGDLPVPGDAPPAAQLHALSGRAAVYATRAQGEGTRHAYRSAWRAYAAWCSSLGREPLGAYPDTIAMYAVRLADDGRSVATLRVPIQAAHPWAGLVLGDVVAVAGVAGDHPPLQDRPARRWAAGCHLGQPDRAFLLPASCFLLPVGGVAGLDGLPTARRGASFATVAAAARLGGSFPHEEDLALKQAELKELEADLAAVARQQTEASS